MNPIYDDGWRKGDRRTGAILAGSAFVVFWLFRAVEMTGGDSDLWYRQIEAGVWWRKRQMFSFAVMQLLYKITNALWGWNGRWAINLSSCIGGFFFVYFAWRLLGNERHRWLAMGLVLSSGFMQLYFGHIETYAWSMVCLLVLFITVRNYYCGRLRAVHVGAAYSLGAAFHLMFGFLFPALLVVVWRSTRRIRDGLQLAWGVTPAAVFTVALFSFLTLGDGEMVGDRFMPFFDVTGTKKHYALLSWLHVREWLWFAWHGSRGPLVLVLGVILTKRLKWNPWVEFLAACVLCFLGFTFIWHPDAGRFDWDLFSFSGLPIALLAVESLKQVEWKPYRQCVAVAICVSTILLMVNVVDAARFGARGEGTIHIRMGFPYNDPKILINVDAHYKLWDVYHVLEGKRIVSVYYFWNEKPVKYTEVVIVEPNREYEVIVPPPWEIPGYEDVAKAPAQ